MSNLPRPSWKLLGSLLMLSLVPVLAGAVRLLGLASNGAVTPENTRFLAMRAPVVVHIVCASLFCVVGAFQFAPPPRLRNAGLHRLAGRVAAPCGIVAALTGLWITAVSAIPVDSQGPLLYGLRMLVGVSMTLALVLAVRAVLQRRIAQHKAWMVRAYALGQGAGTQVLLMLPVTLLTGAPKFIVRDVLMASAWGLNAVFAEWIIRRGLPSSQVFQESFPCIVH
jgi:hypothetical protein